MLTASYGSIMLDIEMPISIFDVCMSLLGGWCVAEP
jgi:hypothetical protein